MSNENDVEKFVAELNVERFSSGDEINAVHYTKGGPWFKEYKECEYAEVWLDYLNTVPKNFIINELM